jgi:uncharacterized protein (TIGR03084 family)
VAVAVVDLVGDLRIETDVLMASVAGRAESVWSLPTPAPDWSVKDQFTHLAFFDEAAVQAATDPAGFRRHRSEVLGGIDGFTGSIADRYRGMAVPDLLDWLATARFRLIEVYSGLDPTTRVPWYGPDMSPASAVTARIMETWAHGQDVFDALAVEHPATPALRHVAHLGVRTFANSFVARGREVPPTEVRVELTGPEGDVWTWGPPGADDRVTGPAVDFCLVVTRRRHLDDARLSCTGAVATEWMAIAQAFAGPPGAGRAAGQFGRRE